MYVDGSGHVDMGFGGETEVRIHPENNEIRPQFESVEEYQASMSAVLEAKEARALGELLIAHSVLFEEDQLA